MTKKYVPVGPLASIITENEQSGDIFCMTRRTYQK